MKLYRSRRDRRFTGLCGGLAEYLNIDATILRVILVISAFFSGGTTILLYFLASLVIPNEPLYDTGYQGYGFAPRYNEGDRWAYEGDHDRELRRERRREYREARANLRREYRRPEPMRDDKEDQIDEMMKEVEKKALEKEIMELKEKLAKLEMEKSMNEKKGE